MNAPAKIGHNLPPDPFEAMSIHVDALFETAQGFLDGEPIANQQTADTVSLLIDEARKARKDAEEMRKTEAKPFDDGKAAVQAKWTPITDEKKGRCALIIDTAKRALVPWLEKLDAEKREAERIAREASAKLAQEAQDALKAASTDLAAREVAESAIEAAQRAERDANRASKDKAHAVGGSRAIGLRSFWFPVLNDPAAALKHYRVAQPAALKAWLIEQAEKDVRTGSRAIPGFSIEEERRAQ